MDGKLGYGKSEYREINQLFNQQLHDWPFLIASHRGFAHADVVENTVPAMRLARKLGADIMETDTSVTFDHQLVMMHPHRERQLFDRDIHVPEITLKQLRALKLHNNIGAATDQQLTTFEEFMTNIPSGMLVHFDRNERHLGLLLEQLDRYTELLPQLTIKIQPTLLNFKLLASHPVKYMVIPVITNGDELALTLTQMHQAINLVGLETVITKQHRVIITPAFFSRILAEHLAPLANSLNLGLAGGQPTELFGPYDDASSLFGDPITQGWGQMAQLGVKMINTDWPRELFEMRAQMGRQATGRSASNH